MTAHILDGKRLAQTLRDDLAARTARFAARVGLAPGLTVVLVGDVAASQVYVRNKESACRAVGIASTVLRLPGDVSEAALLDHVDRLNADPGVHGILVQLPLPRHIRDERVIEHIDQLKDVDGFHPANVGLLALGRPRFVPCTPLGIRALLNAHQIETCGARAVVLGRSNIVGKPMALLLLGKGQGGDATVTIGHTATREAAALAREADLLIVAMGQPEAVRADWVRPGAVVIDVGIHRRPDGSLRGDVAFDEVAEVASWITPVPGGVGPMTVAMLLANTVQAAELHHPDPNRVVPPSS